MPQAPFSLFHLGQLQMETTHIGGHWSVVTLVKARMSDKQMEPCKDLTQGRRVATRLNLHIKVSFAKSFVLTVNDQLNCLLL